MGQNDPFLWLPANETSTIRFLDFFYIRIHSFQKPHAAAGIRYFFRWVFPHCASVGLVCPRQKGAEVNPTIPVGRMLPVCWCFDDSTDNDRATYSAWSPTMDQAYPYQQDA